MGRPGRRRIVAVSVIGLAAGALTGCGLFGSSTPKPDAAARTFLSAWSHHDLAAAAAATDGGTGARTALQSITTGLGAGARPDLAPGPATVNGNNATVAYHASWTLPGVAGRWTYDGRLSMVRAGDTWTVHWEPADVHPRLATDDRLQLHRTSPARAALLDAAGNPLFSRVPVVTVGIEPKLVPDLPGLAGTLAGVLNISAADILSAARKARPTDFVPVITLRAPDYAAVRSRIHDLPGTVFAQGERLLAPTSTFAQPLLGRVGDATAEVIKQVGPAYEAGDQLGLSGLQRALNATLAGRPGATIGSVDPGGTERGTVGTVPATAGTAVRTTLDRAVQTAADAAVATMTTPAAVVAVRPSTGELLAVANNAAAPYDLALTGRYPAGSTFKTITATALLSAGVAQEASTVACPGTTTVFGRVFENENRFDLGQVPLRTAFSQSCNTTFTALSTKLSGSQLLAAAADYGIGTTWNLPVDSFGGSLPPPKDDTEKAADAIGQGRVEISPLSMALVAAAVDRGGAVTPTLIAGSPAKPSGQPPAGPPAPVLAPLRDMMRAVVTEGTARQLSGLPGPAVSGKTGTAEYGTATPPRSHAWFIGFRGDLAFAVFVYDGQSSGTTAVPVAHTFLAALPG